MSYSIGLDPGKEGGVAVLGPTGKMELAAAMPVRIGHQGKSVVDPCGLLKLLDFTTKVLETTVYLEDVNAFPNGSRVAAFSFGRNFESLITFCELEGLHYEFVRPLVWQTELFGPPIKRPKGVKLSKKEKEAHKKFLKQRSIDYVHSAYPNWISKIKSHDGICDAVCIAEYGRRRINK